MRGGTAGAYCAYQRDLLGTLSKLSDSEIEMLLERSTPSLQLPVDASIYRDESSDTQNFANIVMLYYLVRTFKPKKIVETGVWSGKTSWSILHALADIGGGTLTSIDLGLKTWAGRPLPTKETGGFVPQELRRHWNLELGDVRELLPVTLKKSGPIDMFYHDSGHDDQQNAFEFNLAYEHVKKNGIICSDDICFGKAWWDFSSRLKSHHEVEGRFGYGYR